MVDQSGNPGRVGGRAWVVLVVALSAFVAASAFQYGLAFLVPALRARGLDLADAGVLLSAPVVGVLSALVAWGAAADRWSERWVLAAGMGGAGVALLGAATVEKPGPLLWALLALAGACGACAQVTTGRLILGWFPVQRRGTAMGIRQTGQPLGVAVAAIALPGLGRLGVGPALLFLAAFCVVVAVLVAVLVRDPAPDGSAAAVAGEASPYREPYLYRIHSASALLVVPQFVVAAFSFDYLVTERGWPPGAAGAVLAAAQAGGAGARLAAGWWSDRAGSRLRPMRGLALITGVVLALLTVTAWVGIPLAVPLVALASVVSVSTNGLAYTAVAERAGRAWAGRALGTQNTAQNVFAAATPPAIGVLLSGAGSDVGYALAFGAVVAFPLFAAAVLPVSQE